MRAGDEKILEWCDEALLARAKKPSVKRAAKGAAKPAAAAKPAVKAAA